MSVVLKMMDKKTVCLVTICTFVWAVVLTLCSCGASKNNNNEILTVWVVGALELMTVDDAAKDETAEVTPPNAETEAEEAFVEEPGGNAGKSHGRAIEITVFEDNYFYENREVSYEELILILDELKEGDIVTIYDDNATLNAYQKVLMILEEREILYMYGDSQEV